MNKIDETPLLRATFKKYKERTLHNQTKCLQLLLEAGAGVNVADSSGFSPVILASSRGHYKQVESLIQAEADVNARTKVEGDYHRYHLPPGTTPLLAAAQFRHALNTFKVLLKSGAHVNIRAEPQLNALEATFSGGYQDGGYPPEEVVTLLHAAGETTDGTAYYEFSIGNAIFKRDIEFPEYLLERQSTDSLKKVCREAIRKYLLSINPHWNLFMRIPQLGLPTRLAHYLFYEEDLIISEKHLH